MRMLRLNTLIWSEAGGKLGQAEASVVHIRLINKCEHASEQNGVSRKKHSWKSSRGAQADDSEKKSAKLRLSVFFAFYGQS